MKTVREEGHYTIKRVKRLPKRGNQNWLYAFIGNTIPEVYRWAPKKKDYETIKLGEGVDIFEDTNLSYNNSTGILEITFADGTSKNVEIVTVTKTSELDNDGENGTDPFITLQEVVIDSALDPTLAMPNNVGGFPAGTTIADVNGLSLTQYVEIKDFPTILAYIQTNKFLSFTGITSEALEVGTVINRTFNLLLNTGQINNGDNTVAGNLVGNLSNVTITDSISSTILTTDNSPLSNNEIYSLSSYIVKPGNNQFSATINHLPGNTVYKDNKNVIGTNLNSNQGAGSIITNSSVISGRYNRWSYLGSQNSSPTISSAVRSLNTNSLLPSSSSGAFSMQIVSGTQEVSIYYPTGKSLTVIDTGNLNNDLSSSFVKTTMSINDANSTAVSYERATIFLGLIGFPQDTNFNVTIS